MNKSISHLQTCVNNLVDTLQKLLVENHPVIARKLNLALYQLDNAKTVEQYQQIGVLLRDTWIEFSQSVYSKEFLPPNTPEPSPSDAKQMLVYTVQYLTKNNKELLKMAKSVFDLTNKIQHDRNIASESPRWCLIMTALSMVMMLDLTERSKKFKEKIFYKCPKCGSLNFRHEIRWEQDFDSSAFEIWAVTCLDCGFYLDEMGRTEGI